MRSLARLLAASAILVMTCLACGGGGPDGPAAASDFDFDGIPDDVDNCPDVTNYRQLDDDGDGFGNACDNCDAVANPSQQDSDADGIGDACEGGAAVDSDGDGVANAQDQFPADRFRCRDVDTDGCDDCTSGRTNPANDGPDADGDGQCDQPTSGSVRITLGVVGTGSIYAADVTLSYPGDRMSIDDDDILPLGPFDAATYPAPAPSIFLETNVLVPDQVTAGATFGTVLPSLSFSPTRDVFAFTFAFTGATPTVADFPVSACGLYDIEAEVIGTATCQIRSLEILP